MEPQKDQEQAEREERERQEAATRLQASLTASPLAPHVPPSSPKPSELDGMRDLINVLVQRVDQVAKTSAEQFSRVQATMEETEATMELARDMIVQQDQQYQELTDLIKRLETGLAALTRVNANLTEIVAALLAPPPQKG
jgi:putative protein kinase ArgK-like GTPase of G3E family